MWSARPRMRPNADCGRPMTRLTAKVMGGEFAPVLGEPMPHLVTVINQEEGQFENAEEEQVS